MGATSITPQERSSRMERINHILKEKAISKEEMASVLGVELEELEEDLNMNQLTKLRKNYNVNPAWMTTGRGEPFVKTIKLPDLSQQLQGVFREIRIDQRYGQEEFGRILGIGRTSVSNIESGRQGITLNVIRTLKHRFGLSYDYIIDGIPDTKESVVVSDLKAKIKLLEKQRDTLLKAMATD